MKWAVHKPVTLMIRPRIPQVIRMIATEVGMANKDLRVHPLVYLHGLLPVFPLPKPLLAVPEREAILAWGLETTNQISEITL